MRHLPGFPMSLIAFSPPYATAMLPVPHLNFNLYNYSFATSRGSDFLKRAKRHDRLIISWSDNTDEWMVKSLANEVDGVITDDPKRFLELCGQWSRSNGMMKDVASQRLSAKESILWLIINFMVVVWELVTALIQGSPRTQAKRALGI